MEYYQAGRDHLTRRGDDAVDPVRRARADFKDHVRTFASVFPYVAVIRGAGGYGAYMLGSGPPIAFEPDAIRAVLARPGVLEDISSAYDSPASTVDDWVDVIAQQHWLAATPGRGLRRRRAADHRRPSAPRVLPDPPPANGTDR